MKKIFILILIICVSITLHGQDSLRISDCEALVNAISKSGHSCLMASYSRKNRLMQLANCYKNNGDIDKGIKLIEANIFDVHDNEVGYEGWIVKLAEFEKYKYGNDYVRNETKNAQPIIEIDEILDFLLKPNRYLDSSKVNTVIYKDFFYVSIELFGKTYSMYPLRENNEKDNEICKGFYLGKVTETELNAHFYERWKMTKMYQELMK